MFSTIFKVKKHFFQFHYKPNISPNRRSLLSGSLNHLKRNQLNLHDNVVVLLQDSEESKRDRKFQISLLEDIRNELKILVSF